MRKEHDRSQRLGSRLQRQQQACIPSAHSDSDYAMTRVGADISAAVVLSKEQARGHRGSQSGL